MVFNATFNNISVLLVGETRVPRENHDLSQVTDNAGDSDLDIFFVR
jgi:hypothetical protein